MDWKLLDDAANIENRNAGNGGDLVKHTVYLTVLRFLLRQEPWSEGLFVRECHAGRGAYRIPEGDPRGRLISGLYSSSTGGRQILLQAAQRSILEALGGWPSGADAVQWYAGSALINAHALSADVNCHKLELYELLPETRRILRSVLNAAHPGAHQPWSVLPEEEQGQEFDGEAYVERNIEHWGKQNLVLLDPFAMWRQASDQSKRDRYGAMIDGLASRGSDAPSLILFWTWGRAFPVADGDLDLTAHPVRNGYSDLRSKLHKAGFHLVLVKWRWGFQFAMWVVVPAPQVANLRDEIDVHCRLLSDHVIRYGSGAHLSHPQVEVTID